MTCENCLEMLTPFVDGELPADEAAEVDQHLKTCVDCEREHRRVIDTSSLIKASLMRYAAPDVLRARLRASLAEPAVNSSAQLVRPVRRLSFGWARSAAAVVLVAIASSALTMVATRQKTSSNNVANAVLSSHIRSLMPGHLTDVASTDQHNVKPWFNGRVNLSPEVPRLDSAGFALVGGRLDYIDGHNVASVVYTRRQHVINVFTWAAPGSEDLAPALSNANGYNMIRSRRAGAESWVVSDLNVAELNEFLRLFEAANPARPPIR
jgi:anti-sigma factor RsiW